nr:hypothetical protein GCM10020093_037620 [Planobispora longispora]
MQQAPARILSQRLPQLVERVADLALEDRAEQLLAGLPVQVDGALADVRPGGHVVDGHPPVAVARQQIGGHVEDQPGAFGPPRASRTRSVLALTGEPYDRM